MKKILPKKIALLIAAVIIIAIMISVTVSVWMPRPIVEYRIAGYAYEPNIFTFNPFGVIHSTTMPDTYTLVNSNTPLMVALYWENKGNIGASLQLTLTVTNANITWYSNYGLDSVTGPEWGLESDGQKYNGTIATFVLETKAHSIIQYRRFNIFPLENSQNFTLTYTLTDTSNAFSLVPIGKTTATYELTNENVYQLLK
jgi:hypothetical protein